MSTCGHRTIKADYLPCPHPDCWKGGKRFVFLRPPPEPAATRTNEPLEPTSCDGVTEVWELGQVRYEDGTTVWGWKAP